MVNRNELKQQLMDKRSAIDFDGNNHMCEGQLLHSHTCAEGWHMNEVLFPRNVFQKLSKKLQGYFWHEINCHICCGSFHFNYGHSRDWREFFYDLQCRRYGDDVVEEYIANAPLKIKRRK